MSTFQFTLNPYLTGPMGFTWDDSRILGHSDIQLVKATRPHVYSWVVAHPAPKGEVGTRDPAWVAEGGCEGRWRPGDDLPGIILAAP